MRYTITKHNYTTYEVNNERGQSLGTIKFNAWAVAKAKITTANAEYDIYAPDFWQVKKEITRNGVHFATIAPKVWKGLEITFENRATLLFKKKSVWGSNEYILVDENGSTFATLNAQFSWSTWGFEYDIEIHDNMLDTELASVMPFIMFYSNRYMRIRRSA
jgi:hypothetical protein